MGERFKQVEAGELAITVAPHADMVVVRVSGALDAAVASVLARELAALEAYSHVDVDLDQLELVDSAGVNALVDARERATRDGRELKLRIGEGRVRRILELAGAGSLLETSP